MSQNYDVTETFKYNKYLGQCGKDFDPQCNNKIAILKNNFHS